jgi:hypothetical protein
MVIPILVLAFRSQKNIKKYGDTKAELKNPGLKEI